MKYRATIVDGQLAVIVGDLKVRCGACGFEEDLKPRFLEHGVDASTPLWTLKHFVLGAWGWVNTREGSINICPTCYEPIKRVRELADREREAVEENVIARVEARRVP